MKDLMQDANSPSQDTDLDRIIKLASLAVGGQGGGVLNNWIIDLAELNGFDVQATSVAGVAQRTGATVYYVEMLQKSGRRPVFSLAPSENDVDILLATELMEAGRAVMRRFIQPGKTRVITSTHRQLATIEKVAPGNGMADGAQVLGALAQICDDLIAFDMKQIADEEGTVISAALFGALAGSAALPFDVESFRETIRASGRGVQQSLAAFDRAYQVATDGAPDVTAETGNLRRIEPNGPDHLLQGWYALQTRISDLPTPARDIAGVGLKKVVTFQDLAYGSEYLDRLEESAALDIANGGAEKEYVFTNTLAKYLANAMAYDDIIRVADVKTHADRMDRIATEVGACETHLVRITEYTHPGAEEIISLMPAKLGRWVEARDRLVQIISRMFSRGHHIRTDRLGGFLTLYFVGGLRRWRRRLLRHQREIHHLNEWIDGARSRLTNDYDLAVELLRARRLIKGYGDTHARGMSKFDRVIAGAARVEGRPDAALWVRRLIKAALKDEKGAALDGALRTIDSFAEEAVNIKQ